MEKRILLSFALSLAVLSAWFWLFSPPPASPELIPDAGSEIAGESETPSVPVESEPAAPPLTEGANVEGAVLESADTEEVVLELEAASVETIRIDTARFVVRINNQGARLESVRLKNYSGAEGDPLELFDSDVGESVGWPLAIATGEAALDEAIQSALFVAEQDANGVRLRYGSGGLQVVKEFSFDPETYAVAVDADVTRNGEPVPFSFVLQGEFGDQSRDYQPRDTNIVYFEAGEFERINVSRLDEPQGVTPTTYVGLEDQFFLAMFRLPNGALPAATGVAVDPAAEDGVLAPRVQVPYDGEAIELYVGPKQQDTLRQVDPNLVETINYGFFEIIVRPLLFVLLAIYGYVGNFGWAIIILTVGINFILFPLRLKQQLSMLKMSKIQPQMRTLQDKLKKLKGSDPRKQEVQAEMMGLYKKHGVNPMGGCLPILLQMPFLFAVFSMLRTSIELRGAPWALWIHDLSAADPYYVMPVLMGGSMFAMQTMTPMTGDPNMVRMMRLMPLVLIVMFATQSSGLMLYWLTGNLLGIGQQYYINKRYRSDDGKSKKDEKEKEEESPPEEVISPEPPPDAEPAAPKRRRRKGRKK